MNIIPHAPNWCDYHQRPRIKRWFGNWECPWCNDNVMVCELCGGMYSIHPAPIQFRDSKLTAHICPGCFEKTAEEWGEDYTPGRIVDFAYYSIPGGRIPAGCDFTRKLHPLEYAWGMKTRKSDYERLMVSPPTKGEKNVEKDGVFRSTKEERDIRRLNLRLDELAGRVFALETDRAKQQGKAEQTWGSILSYMIVDYYTSKGQEANLILAPAPIYVQLVNELKCPSLTASYLVYDGIRIECTDDIDNIMVLRIGGEA